MRQKMNSFYLNELRKKIEARIDPHELQELITLRLNGHEMIEICDALELGISKRSVQESFDNTFEKGVAH